MYIDAQLKQIAYQFCQKIAEATCLLPYICDTPGYLEKLDFLLKVEAFDKI